MKKLIAISLWFLFICVSARAQNTSISDISYTPDSSAVLDVYSTSRGLLVPRMTQAQRMAISSPANSLLTYQTDGTPGFYYYSGSGWSTVATGAGTQWTTSGSDIYYTTGKVGIGTPAPSSPLNVQSTSPTTGTITLAKFEGTANSGSSGNYVYTQIANNSGSNSKTAIIFGGASANIWALGNDIFANNGQNFWIYDFNTFTTPFFISSSGFTGLGSISPNSRLHVEGSISLPVTTKTTTYTATANDYTILCNTGSMTVNLPTASGITGRVYVIKKISGSAGTITIDPSGLETIDGATTHTSITSQYQSITVQSDGSKWFILSKN